MRGGILAWRSLMKHVIHPHNADIAYIGPPIVDHEAKKLLSKAKFLWIVPDYDDWGDALDLIQNNTWRYLCDEKHSNFLGFVKSCPRNSAGVLLAYRYFTANNIVKHNLVNTYDWFIFTRTDYFYLCPPFHPMRIYSNSSIYIPSGEEYGGYTDRIALMPSNSVLKTLNVTVDIVTNPYEWENFSHYNIESALKHYYDKVNISVIQYAHTGFTVRRVADPTSWSGGVHHQVMAKFNLTVKYPGELATAETECRPLNVLDREYMDYPSHFTSSHDIILATNRKLLARSNNYDTTNTTIFFMYVRICICVLLILSLVYRKFTMY